MKIVVLILIGFVALHLLGKIINLLFFDIPHKIDSARRRRAQERNFSRNAAANERLMRQQAHEADQEAEKYLRAYRSSPLTQKIAQMIQNAYVAHTEPYTFSATLDMYTIRAGRLNSLSELGYKQFDDKFQMYACAKAVLEQLGPDYKMQATLYDYDISPRVTISRPEKKVLKDHF